MSKIRVSNVAEKLGLETREVLARLKDIGVEAKTATSLVEEDVVARLSPPQPKEGGTEEVRVTTNIIRRRAKVVAAPEVEEPPAVQESPVVQEAPAAKEAPAKKAKPVETVLLRVGITGEAPHSPSD